MLKRAVSPLVATVLLLAFSVVLGAIVMNFSGESTNELTDQAQLIIDSDIKCTIDLPIKILRRNNENLICYNRSGSKNLEVILENQGSTAAAGIRVFLLDAQDNIKTQDIQDELQGHSTAKYNFSIATTNDGSDFVFPPTKVLISPLVTSGTSLVVCDENRIDLEDIAECS